MTNDENSEVVELQLGTDAAFADLMDALAPSEDPEVDGPGGEATDAAPAESGQSAVADGAAGDPGAGTAADSAGDAGEPAVPGDAPVAGVEGSGSAGSAVDVGRGSVDYSTIQDAFGEISTAIEENAVESHREQALDTVREENPKYFEAIQVHPRVLVGQTVPSVQGEGEEVLRSSEDARNWQEAVKQILAAEVQSQARQLAEADRGTLDIVHGAVELFQNNSDLVPGTKQFDKELADRFAAVAEPYEFRVDGKLTGYTLAAQPLIDSLRKKLEVERSAKQAAPPAAAPAPKAKAPAKKPEHQPQKGITSKPGQVGEEEDFSTLFGTLGLPGLRI